MIITPEQLQELRATIAELRTENALYRDALHVFYGYFKYQGVVVTFSPTDYAYLRDVVTKALAGQHWNERIG